MYKRRKARKKQHWKGKTNHTDTQLQKQQKWASFMHSLLLAHALLPERETESERAKAHLRA